MWSTNLYVHWFGVGNQPQDSFVFTQAMILSGSFASRLALGGTADELAHHVEFSPVDLARMLWIRLLIALMGLDKIGHMHFPMANKSDENAEDMYDLKCRTRLVCRRPSNCAEPSGRHDGND